MNLDPSIVGLFIGTAKPEDVDQFLLPICDEISSLCTQGGVCLVEGRPRVPIRVRCFTADTPAKSYLTSMRYFNHASGCHRCTQTTTTVRDGRKRSRVFESVSGDHRTDESHASRRDKEHHDDAHKIKQSIMENFGYRMVSQFPIDVMHLIDLGVTKQIVLSVIRQVKSGNVRFNYDCQGLSSLYKSYSKMTPYEFSRRPVH